MNLRALVSFCVLISTGPAVAEFLVRCSEKTPPAELGSSIRESLQHKSVQVMDGGQPVYEFWLRKELPLKSVPGSPAKALESVPEATLFGAVMVHGKRRDYRDDEINPGVYTLRFGLQPEDGDHLGTAPFPFFLVMIPAKSDDSLDGIKAYKPMVKASGRNTASGHPNILSLRPPGSAEGEWPRLTEPEAEHRAVVLKIPARPPGAAAPTELGLELVVQGHTSHL
jgi:hypothetical protein